MQLHILSGLEAQKMRSRRLTAEWFRRSERPRRIVGTILVCLGALLWITGVILPILHSSVILTEVFLGVIFGGALVVAAIILIVL